MIRKILIGLLVILILIQFIRPARNVNGVATHDITHHYMIPDRVLTTLKTSCYDCHSNNTHYPWYTNVQPIGMWLTSHVRDGKRHLNFDEFGLYSTEKAKDKFDEIEDAATNGWMPLKSYLIMHRDAKLTPEEARELADWARTLKQKVGSDSVVSKL